MAPSGTQNGPFCPVANFVLIPTYRFPVGIFISSVFLLFETSLPPRSYFVRTAMFSIVWARCDGLSKIWDKLSLPGNRTPDISARPWFGLFWQNLPQIVPAGPSGTQNGPFCPVAGPSTKKWSHKIFETTFIGQKCRRDSGLCRQIRQKGPKNTPTQKKAPRAGVLPLDPRNSTDQTIGANPTCSQMGGPNSRLIPSISPSREGSIHYWRPCAN